MLRMPVFDFDNLVALALWRSTCQLVHGRHKPKHGINAWVSDAFVQQLATNIAAHMNQSTGARPIEGLRTNIKRHSWLRSAAAAT